MLIKGKTKENASTPRASKSSSGSSKKTTPPLSKNRNNKKSSITPRTEKAAKKTNNNKNLIFRVVHHGENGEYIYLSVSEKLPKDEWKQINKRDRKFEVGNRYNYGEEEYEVVARKSDEIVLKKVVQQKTKKQKKRKNKKSEKEKKKRQKLKELKEKKAKILEKIRLIMNNKKLYSLEEQINNTLKF